MTAAEQRAERGFSTEDTYSFDVYLAKVIAGGVRELLERNMSHPEAVGPDEWNAILEKIATGYEAYARQCFKFVELPPEFREAQELLTKWWCALWD